MKRVFLLVCVLGLVACSPSISSTSSVPSETLVSSTRTITTEPEPTSTQLQPTLTPVPAATQIPFEVCVPLEDETFESLQQILWNPLDIPPFGNDGGHHGLDFAYYQKGERLSIQGIEIYAILAGKIVLILGNDIPYGYAIIIETPLSNLPSDLKETLLAQYLPIPEEVFYKGECPEVIPPELTGAMSVYHLYAHMEDPPAFDPGDAVSCGEKLGTVGTTGRSTNPHLHLETRLGPSSADLSTMAYYSVSYSDEQRSTYCLWRMSGYYQLFDPFLLFDAVLGGT